MARKIIKESNEIDNFRQGLLDGGVKVVEVNETDSQRTPDGEDIIRILDASLKDGSHKYYVVSGFYFEIEGEFDSLTDASDKMFELVDDGIEEEIKLKESLARFAQTDSQEASISFIEKSAKELGINLRFGTSVGKEPQTVILDWHYQDGVIRVSSNGACEINGEEIGHYSDDWFDIEDYKGAVRKALKSLLEEEVEEESLTEAKAPKFWDSQFTCKVIDAYKSGDLTQGNIDEWETAYNDGRKPNPSLGTKEILKYHIDTGKDPRNESLTEGSHVKEGDRVKLDNSMRVDNGAKGTLKTKIGQLCWVIWDDGTKTQEIDTYLVKEALNESDDVEVIEKMDQEFFGMLSKVRTEAREAYDKYINTGSLVEAAEILSYLARDAKSAYDYAKKHQKLRPIECLNESDDIDSVLDRLGGADSVRSRISDTRRAYPGIEDDELVDMLWNDGDREDWEAAVEYVGESLKEGTSLPPTRFKVGDIVHPLFNDPGMQTSTKEQWKVTKIGGYDRLNGFTYYITPHNDSAKQSAANWELEDDAEIMGFENSPEEQDWGLVEGLTEGLEGKYPWFINNSAGYDGVGLFLTIDGKYKKCHYTQADLMTAEDAKSAVEILNARLKSPVKSMDYYLESLTEMAVPSSDYKRQAAAWVALEVYKANSSITRTSDNPGVSLQIDKPKTVSAPAEVHITPHSNTEVRVICRQTAFDQVLDLVSAVNYILSI